MPTFLYPTDFSNTLWRVLDGDLYVSYAGNDSTGNGSPQSPFATIQQAISTATSGQKIVIGTGHYNENTDGENKNCVIAADGTVEMYGTDIHGSAFTNMGSSSVIQGLKIFDYDSCVDTDLLRFEDCFIENAYILGAVTTLLRCVVKDSVILDDVTDLLNCTFISAGKPNDAGGTTVENCIFDSASSFAFASSSLQFFDNCNQESGSVIQIDSTNYNTASAVNTAFSQYQANGKSVASLFNASGRNDYTLKATSTLLQSGTHSQPIGAFGFARSFDSTSLGGVGLTNVIIDQDGFYTLPEETPEGSIETKIIDLGSKRVMGRVDLFAEENFSTDFFGSVTYNQDTAKPPRPITFLMRFAANDFDVQKTDYKEFIWDKQPTVDSNNRGNGDPKFNALNEGVVYTRYVQFKIILRHTSEPFFILQENADLILQENGSKLKQEIA